MEMGQIVAIGLVGTVFSVMLKKQVPELALMIAIATGVIIFLFVCAELSKLLALLKETADKAGVSDGYFLIIMKVLGIAYLSQFGMQICLDAGESAIASKIELAGKVLIMAVSAPILMSLLDVIMGLAR